MKNLLFVFIGVTVLLCFSGSACSVVQRSAFSVDTANVKNLHIQKTDSIQFKPFK
mgnify:CR=1 FL=1